MIKDAVALFGGGFDPVHVGHVRLVQEVQKRFGFETLWVIPSQNPPHKPPHTASRDQRLEMLNLAFEGMPGVRISTFEMDRKDPSYSITTIKHFKSEHPGKKLFFVIGADAFYGIPEWYQFPEVFEACSYLVVSRAGWDDAGVAGMPIGAESATRLDDVLAELKDEGLISRQLNDPLFNRSYQTCSGERVCLVDLQLPEVSATEVRLRLQLGQSATGLVPQSVEAYLKTKAIYDNRTRDS